MTTAKNAKNATNKVANTTKTAPKSAPKAAKETAKEVKPTKSAPKSTKSTLETKTEKASGFVEAVKTIFEYAPDMDALILAANTLAQELKDLYDARRKEIEAAEKKAAESKLTAQQKKQVEALTTCYDMGFITDEEYNAKYAQITGIKTESKPTENKVTEKKTSKSESKTEKHERTPQVKITSLTAKDIKAMNIKFTKYSEKCYFVQGNTRAIADEIKANGAATFNSKKEGWYIRNEEAKKLAKALKIKIA